MTHEPVDLGARRANTAQEIEAGRRRCLKEFRQGLVELKKDQKRFSDRLDETIATFELGGTRVSTNSPGTDSAMPHVSGVEPITLSKSPTASHSDAKLKPGVDAVLSTEQLCNVRTLRQPAMPNGNAATAAADPAVPTAIVYCEANFAELDGKTANGLVRHSEKYNILAVIDSKHAGQDAGTVLDNKPNGIPICRDLSDGIGKLGDTPDYFIYGMAPSSGMLSQVERTVVLDAIGVGINIVSGLHEFLSDDSEFAEASLKSGAQITDVRKPPDKTKLHAFSGRIRDVTCPRIAILGTDCAIGKRTTASILTRLLVGRGINAVMIGTGQTGLMQGAKYGVALDAIPSQFCAGELEAVVVEAFERENPDVIIVEGQGALSHPAFSTSAFILRGSQPDGVILQHAPGRHHRCDFEYMPMPTPQSEINMIQAFSDTKVIGITINHENMSDGDVDAAIAAYEGALGIQATDAISRPPDRLVEMIAVAYPELREKLSVVLQ